MISPLVLVSRYSHAEKRITTFKSATKSIYRVCTPCISTIVISGMLSANFANASEKLEEVVVISSGVETPLREVATSVSVIEQQAIELRGFTQLGDILRTDVGIASSNSGGLGQQSTLRIRGEEGYRTLVLIDGIEITDPTPPQSAPQINHLMTGNSVARVEVLRGPQGFIYGADAGGVINISTKTPEEGSKFSFFNEIGRFNTQTNSAAWSVGSDQGAMFLSLDDVSSDGFNARSDDPTADEDGYENTTEHGKLIWKGERREAQLVVRHTAATSEYDQCYTVPFTPTPVNDCGANFDQALGKLNISLDGEILNHDISFSRSETKTKHFTQGVQTRASNGAIEKVQYIGHLGVSDNQRIVFGSDVKTEEVTNEENYQSRDQVSVFGEWQAELLEQTFVTYGARFDDNEDYGEHISQRLSFAYLQDIPGDIIFKYRGSLGNGFRAPSLYEINYNTNYGFGDAATVVLKEETSEGAEIALDMYFPDTSELSIVYFEQEITDQIQFDLVNYSGYLQTTGTSTSKGVELVYSKALLSWLDIQANATYNNAKTDDGDQRVRRPKQLANLTLTGHFFEDDLWVNISSRTSRDAIETDGEALDDYTVLDLNVQYRWSDKLTMHARINNLSDREYEEIRNYMNAGRAVYAGVRVEF